MNGSWSQLQTYVRSRLSTVCPLYTRADVVSPKALLGAKRRAGSITGAPLSPPGSSLPSSRFVDPCFQASPRISPRETEPKKKLHNFNTSFNPLFLIHHSSYTDEKTGSSFCAANSADDLPGRYPLPLHAPPGEEVHRRGETGSNADDRTEISDGREGGGIVIGDVPHITHVIGIHDGARRDEKVISIAPMEDMINGRTMWCINRAPAARMPKKANKGCRPRCNVMRRVRKRLKTGR